MILVRVLAAILAPQSARQFFQNVGRDWLSNLQDFARHDLPRLVVVMLFAWLPIWLVNLLTRRMVKLAEARGGDAIARAAQTRTLASVLRATGIAIVGFLAALQVLHDVFDFNLAPLLTSAGVAGVAIGLAAQTIVKESLNGMLILAEDQYNVGNDWPPLQRTGALEQPRPNRRQVPRNQSLPRRN